MLVNINNIQGLNDNQAIITRDALSPCNQNTDLNLMPDYGQKDQKPEKKRVTLTNDFSVHNCSDQKKDDSKLNTDRHMNDRLSISNQQHQRTESIQNQGDQFISYPQRVTEVAQNTEFNPTLSDNNQNEQLEQRLDQQYPQNNNQNQNQVNINEEDKVKSLMIMKSVIIKSMNVYVFLIFESAQIIMDFDYKVVISILLLFDFFSLYTNFQKYRLNKKVDIDEYQTEEEIEFREEYNKYLLLKVIEIVVFFIFKILLIIKFDVVNINFVIVTTIVFTFVVFKILYMFKLKVKEYNPIFNETMLLLFKLFVSFQALLVSLKLEYTVDWDWVHIFWPAYVFLLATAFITLGLVFIILSKCYFSLKRSSQKKVEIIGLLWICIFMISFTVTSVMFLKSFIVTEDQGDDLEQMQAVLFISLVFLLLMFLFSALEWNKIIQFVYEISIIVQADEEEDIEYVISENPEQNKKEKNKTKRIKTVNPTEQDEQNNVPLFLQKLSSTYFSAIANRQNLQNNLAKNNSKIKQQAKEQKQNGNARHKSQSFMIQKYEFNNSIDFNKKPIQDINVSASQRNKQGDSDSNKWKKIALDTNQKFKKLIDTPQIQKLSQQLNSQVVKKKLFENYNSSPKNARVSKSNNVSFVGHQDSHRGANKKIEQSIIEDKDIKVNAPNMNDQSNVTCVICFDNAPDSVYMPCGHGGVCYECSVDIMKNTGECYLCREAIKEILRLDIKEKAQNNNFRVVALTTLVDESIIEDKKKNENNLNNINEVEEDNND